MIGINQLGSATYSARRSWRPVGRHFVMNLARIKSYKVFITSTTCFARKFFVTTWSYSIWNRRIPNDRNGIVFRDILINNQSFPLNAPAYHGSGIALFLHSIIVAHVRLSFNTIVKLAANVHSCLCQQVWCDRFRTKCRQVGTSSQKKSKLGNTNLCQDGDIRSSKYDSPFKEGPHTYTI